VESKRRKMKEGKFQFTRKTEFFKTAKLKAKGVREE
jgi:hypothetical protein